MINAVVNTDGTLIASTVPAGTSLTVSPPEYGYSRSGYPTERPGSRRPADTGPTDEHLDLGLDRSLDNQPGPEAGDILDDLPDLTRPVEQGVDLATDPVGGALGVTQSTGAVGTSADNSLAEAFNATLKREMLQDFTAWPDQATRRVQVFRWLIRYNTRRRHSWCRYQSPTTYEITTAATLPSAA